MWMVLALLLLVLPRFFLISIDDSGVRTEDVLLLLLLPATVSLLVEQRRRLTPLAMVFIGYLMVVVAAAFKAGWSGHMPLLTSLAFGLRPALYVCALVIGFRLGWRGQGPGMVTIGAWALAIHLAYGAGASLGVIPNVASFHPSRLSGLTNGPYEMSAIACLLCVAFAAQRQVGSTVAGVVALVWTQSRVALVGLLLQLGWSTLKSSLWLRVAVVAVASGLVGFVVSTRDAGGATLADTLSVMDDLREAFAQVATSRDAYFDAAYSDGANGEISALEGDPSALLRVARWTMVLTTATDSYWNFLLGMGPGFYSVALDGNYIRLVGETGLLGLLSFLAIGVMIWKTEASPWHRRVLAGLMLQLAVVAVFIDVFVALKPMCLFWMLVGALLKDAEASRGQ